MKVGDMIEWTPGAAGPDGARGEVTKLWADQVLIIDENRQRVEW